MAPRLLKFAIGLAVVLVAAWISHGPLGQGAAFVDQLQRDSETVLQATELPGLHVRFERDPLSREAILSGAANDFQREGMGHFPGINGRIAAVPGVSGVRWES